MIFFSAYLGRQHTQQERVAGGGPSIQGAVQYANMHSVFHSVRRPAASDTTPILRKRESLHFKIDWLQISYLQWKQICGT